MKHQIKELTFENGLKGLLIDVPDATVLSVDFNFRAGDFRSPKGKWEVAHVLEHLVLGSNAKYPRAREFQSEFQKNGAYMNASTGPYDLNYISECADFEWQRILELLKLSLESPLLPEQEFKAEMGNVREELTGDLNHDFRQILIRSREKFGLVALSDSERLQQMKNITLQDIRNYYKQTHLIGNMRFTIAGNVFSRQKEIEEILQNLQLGAGNRVDLPDETPTKFDDVFYIDKPGLENIYFFLTTFSNTQFTQREEDALSMLNTMLTATMHSRILGEARERGLAYDIASSSTKSKQSTGWWFGAELTEQNALPVFEIIKTELARLLNSELDDADIEAARHYSLGKYQRSAQTVRGLSIGYSAGYFFDDTIHDYYAIPDRIRQVTRQDMIAVAHKLFAEDCWGLAIMGTDKDELAKELHHHIASLWN